MYTKVIKGIILDTISINSFLFLKITKEVKSTIMIPTRNSFIGTISVTTLDIVLDCIVRNPPT